MVISLRRYNSSTSTTVLHNFTTFVTIRHYSTAASACLYVVCSASSYVSRCLLALYICGMSLRVCGSISIWPVYVHLHFCASVSVACIYSLCVFLSIFLCGCYLLVYITLSLCMCLLPGFLLVFLNACLDVPFSLYICWCLVSGLLYLCLAVYMYLVLLLLIVWFVFMFKFEFV